MPANIWLRTLFFIFTSVTSQNGSNKQNDSVLFISITSGPHHHHLRQAIRSSWLIPCSRVDVCDYRFFVDAANKSSELNAEISLNSDIITRDSCDLMSRHPHEINYGNSQLHSVDEHGKNVSYAYEHRRLYKIDWKVCFLKWALANGRMAAYHIFVEDDSFVCTDSLMHLTKTLYANPVPPFRTGAPMFDGFDDSSTLMSREVALAFAEHYPTTVHCDHVAHMHESKFGWLSWGNSWTSKTCDWRKVLKAQLNMTVHSPAMGCSLASKDMALKSSLPCPPLNPVVHGASAGENMAKNPLVPRMCDYVLLLDKVKEPLLIMKLWDLTGGTESMQPHKYIDFSPVFRGDGSDGWRPVLESIARCSSTNGICRRLKGANNFDDMRRNLFKAHHCAWLDSVSNINCSSILQAFG